tara:strand:+ start:699 stop:1262 length:564 start_codon:yes stop_codon:yes gene_type:complete
MALEIFTGTQAECNAVITKVNTALGYTGSTSICIPYAIDASNDIYEVLIKTGTQKNALDTSEQNKVVTTRSFENQDIENAKNMSTLERPEIGFNKITRLDLSIPRGAVLADGGGTCDVSARVTPSDATDKTVFRWSIDNSNYATLQNTTGSVCTVTSGNRTRGRTVTIKCNSTDGSRVFGTIQLTIQ